ncbi:hypothetical protein B9Z19DRAFT_1168392 [Tuber borchii]|uniref:dolichyl-phosphate beta-D-mannosyltransferase n=1 Tax=Tuber borchii TaxID=42251 RepID=A0A2T7A048_TUBBO|nr:hypothetical protein B9Z19DRAFT_1168392 [Tuber borchii]
MVDDASPDITQEVGNQLVTLYGANRLLKPPAGNLGRRTVYVHELQFATGNFVIIMPFTSFKLPKFIPDFITLQKTKDYDIVTGTRYAGNRGVYRWDFKRKLVSCGANSLACCAETQHQ